MSSVNSLLQKLESSKFILDKFSNFEHHKLMFNTLTNFFNPTTIMDFFFTKNDIFVIPFIQDIISTNTDNFIMGTWKLINNDSFLIKFNIDLIFLYITDPNFNKSDLYSLFELNLMNNNIYTNMVNELLLLTSPKTDPFNLIEMFPQHEITFEIFEIISVNIDNSLYEHLNLPEVKLYYPEPYIASPSFAHEELWFIHILHYQHWLWFFFISLIMLFFITFINVARWSNPRIRPKRETRGVSRSKCADLITACVPVSWAATIIISESVDATDYYDGFGTGEIVIGIRAYQWGWEYFFPKNIDLNYNVNPTYSSVVGNSLKYSTTSDLRSDRSNFWRGMRSKINSSTSSSPAHVILSPTDNNKIINFIDFNSLGTDSLRASNSFKKIQLASKANKSDLSMLDSNFSLNYSKISDLYMNDLNLSNTKSYGIDRQSNYGSIYSSTNTNQTYIDNKSIETLLHYNMGKIGFDKTSKDLINNLINLKEGFSKVSSQVLTKEIFNNKLEPSLNLPESYSNDPYYFKKLSHKVPSNQILPPDRSVRNYLNLTKSLNIPLMNMNMIGKMPTSLNNTHITSTSGLPTGLNLSYDKFTKTNQKPAILSANDDLAPNFIFTSFWVSLWANSTPELRLLNLGKFDRLKSNVIVPNIMEYDEYDFRNWQTLELIEDAFWESTFSFYIQDEYENILRDLNNLKEYREDEEDEYINEVNCGEIIEPLNKLYKRLSLFNLDSIYPFSLYSEELTTLNSTLPTKLYQNFENDLNIDIFEDIYTNVKFIDYMNYNNHSNIYTTFEKSNLPLSHLQILNSFRSSYEDPSNLSESLLVNDPDQITWNNDLRHSNFLKLRLPAKNSIVTFNAFQKVFRPRIDEGRSHMSYSTLSNNTSQYPLISGHRARFEKILAKNSSNFFQTTQYKKLLSHNYSILNPLMNSTNVYFTDIPFLLSMQSDSARHMWFDWHSRWTSIEIQPSSVARYSLVGMPYSTKNFEYNTKDADDIKESESYMLKLTKARRNYLSNWALTPYLYNRLSNWYMNRDFIQSTLIDSKISDIRIVLELSKSVYSNKIDGNFYSRNTSGFNEVNTPGRSAWKPISNIHGYGYIVPTLTNILTKREYLYREYFLNKGFSVNLPNYLSSSPVNPLLREIKSSYSLIDPLSHLSELQRDIFYDKLFLYFFNNYNFIGNIVSGNMIFSNLFLYLFDIDSMNKVGSNNDLYKSQFRPMRKGISNMIRLHATGAIALPIEVRLHILASSKDIIHSWAIPSAGIKIDCVPGYSSHRIAIFLVSGIFWGQCMEICGRFHHWMPIIVYFTKVDLFFLWVTHFIHMDPASMTLVSDSRSLNPRISKLSL